MNMTKDEALRMALEALEESLEYVEEEAENAQRLYGKYPTRQARIQGLKDDARKHMDAITAIREVLAQPKRPAVPERKPWVGLTDEEISVRASNFYNPEMYKRAVLWAQEKLKERNK